MVPVLSSGRMVHGWFYEGVDLYYMGWSCQLIGKLVVVLGRVIRV